MKTVDNERVVKIRPAFGSIRHIKVEGEEYYREARRESVIFECAHDETAWDLCGPQPKQQPIDL